MKTLLFAGVALKDIRPIVDDVGSLVGLNLVLHVTYTDGVLETVREEIMDAWGILSTQQKENIIDARGTIMAAIVATYT